MKKYILLFVSLTTLILSCDDDGNGGRFEDVVVARPITMTNAEFANSVDVIAPAPIGESGKIYAYQDYIFVNDKYQGVHVVDNTHPESPQTISFIKIPGNMDISVKDDFLYADSLTDLIVLDISDINNIEVVNRLKGVLENNVVWPAADVYEWEGIDDESEVLVGWETAVERRVVEESDLFAEDVATTNANESGDTGQGGSLARFKIVDDYLYAVDWSTINIFDISDLEAPQVLEGVHTAWGIETIFNQEDFLFLGGTQGMYIYDISEPATPEYISEFVHATACDPVVVDGNYAYVTLRGGNFCGAVESGLYIIDISTIETPELKMVYPMDDPYGLGVRDDQLFVCDGGSGLKVYDTSNIPDLLQLNHFKDVIAFDVIPLEEQLLMIGDGILYQYEYLENEIRLLSGLVLN